jgi:Arc/MetJ-type ribon-helix-helix transcriptional regulator
MNVQLNKPRFERFIADKVKAGDFPSAEAVVEDALARVMDDEIVLTDSDIAAIERAAEQFERGEGMDFHQFAARAKKKYGIK